MLLENLLDRVQSEHDHSLGKGAALPPLADAVFATTTDAEEDAGAGAGGGAGTSTGDIITSSSSSRPEEDI
jgi:hypothetical protein